jgi:hypothetical protein
VNRCFLPVDPEAQLGRLRHYPALINQSALPLHDTIQLELLVSSERGGRNKEE